MSLAAKLLSASGGMEKLYVDDVFSAYTRTGTGASATITTGIDMTKGYTLWSKGRSGATDHAVYDSARGVTFDLATNTTAAQTTQATGLTAVSATGHTIGALGTMNTSAATYVDWVFREAAKFHKVVSVVKSAGSNATVDLSTLGVVGRVNVKRTDAAGSWYVWHRSLTAGKLLIGETTAAEATLGHITVSGSTVTLVNGVIADGTYLVEAFAHDTSADGIIQCGSFLSPGSGDSVITLGWEPQYILFKSHIGTARDWNLFDTSRGMSYQAGKELLPNSSAAEVDGWTVKPTATGFSAGVSLSRDYIYLAIRRPNKPPTLGTQVYNAIARTGTGAAATVTGVGFAPDASFIRGRVSSIFNNALYSRLPGEKNRLDTAATAAEAVGTDEVLAYTMDGVSIGANNGVNQNAVTYINHFFRRAPGVFDEVCYTGTGVAKTEAHNLGVVPELMIVKSRSNVQNWPVYSAAVGNTGYLLLNGTNAAVTGVAGNWNNTSPTSSVFTVGADNRTNASAYTYVAYLFATLAGVSKVGSYTGNGSSQTINCGFTTGARFVLIKRTDAAGDWFIWDTVRGLVAGSDPHLSLNTTAAEVTSDDSIDPDASGFIVNQLAATNINVNGATYIGLAIA